MANAAVTQISQSAVKSVQRGLGNLSGSTYEVNLTVSGVNVAKTIVRVTGTANSDTDVFGSQPFGFMSNATTLVVARGGGNSMAFLEFAYEVIEFN